MWKFGYWYIFTCSIDLEGYLIDLNNGMLQIAAYLQHIYCKGNFSKIINSVKMKLRITYLWSLIILSAKFPDAAASISATSICCSNQKCSSNLLQNCIYEKLRLLVYFYMLYWSGRLPRWSKQQYAANGSTFAVHLLQIASTQNYESSQDETQTSVSLESNNTSYQISWCCSNQKCCSYLLLQPEVLQQLAAKLRKCKTETEIWKTGKSRFAANCSKFGWLFSLGSTVFHQIEKLTFSLTDADLCINYN